MTKYTKGKAVKLSSNFKSSEMDCKGRGCCSTTLVDNQLIKHLQKIRNHFGKPVVINSGFRCSTHNKAVGGSSGSKHKQGAAADIKINGVSPRKVAAYAEKIGVKGIGLYDTFTHIDTRTKKFYWYSYKQERRSTFQQVILWHK